MPGRALSWYEDKFSPALIERFFLIFKNKKMSKLIIKRRYATTPNELLENETISLKAKGMFAFLQAKPENWRFSTRRIAKQNKDGITSTGNALKELEKRGYLRRKPARSAGGNWNGYDYILYEKPSSENPTTVKPFTAKGATLSKQKNSKQKKVIKTSEQARGINSLIDLFKPLNPSYERLFSNKTQRDSLQRLVKKHGYKKISETIKFLPDLVSQPFCPQISTPYQLEMKLGNLIYFYNQSKNKKHKITKL